MARRELAWLWRRRRWGELAAALRRGGRPGKTKRGRGTARTGAGGVKAAPRRVVAYVIRALATHGRRRGHAARGFCWCRPLNGTHSVRQTFDGRLTACFQIDLSANPWLLRANILNRFCRPMYQLQLFLKDHALIRNQNQVISSPMSA